jgi:hypothetical protein
LIFDGGLFFEGFLGIRVFFLFGVFGEDIAFDLLGVFGVRDFTSGFTGNVDFLYNIHK